MSNEFLYLPLLAGPLVFVILSEEFLFLGSIEEGLFASLKMTKQSGANPRYFDLLRDWLSKFTNKRKAPALPSGNWREKDSPV